MKHEKLETPWRPVRKLMIEGPGMKKWARNP